LAGGAYLELLDRFFCVFVTLPSVVLVRVVLRGDEAVDGLVMVVEVWEVYANCCRLRVVASDEEADGCGLLFCDRVCGIVN